MMPSKDNLEKSEVTLDEIKSIVIDLLKLFLNQVFYTKFEKLMKAELIGKLKGGENFQFMETVLDLILDALLENLNLKKVNNIQKLCQLLPFLDEDRRT